MSNYQGNIIIKNPATPTGPAYNGSAPGIWRLDEVAYWIKQGVWPNANVVPDTYFPYVSLLLSTTALGNANNNLFVDSSGAFNPISRNGNTTQGSFTPYGASWSNYFDGSGDFLSAPSNAAFDLGSSSFTVECWFNANSFAAGFGLISRYNYTSVGLGWLITIQNSTTVRFVRGNDIILDCTVSAMSTGAWYHVAAVRNGSTLTVYLNGVQVGQATGISNFTDAATALQIGRTNTITNDINGYISNARVVKGTAVYTAAFTPPTSNLTAITNTSLLTCQSNRFRDASTNNFTVTPAGNTSVTEFSPFAPAYPGISYNQSDITNWSGYFDGTGDNLTIPSNAAFGFGTGDFTIEFWAYIPTWTGDAQLIGCHTAFVGYDWLIQQFSSGQFRWLDASLILQSGTVPVTNQWNHYAVTRSGTTLRIFLNGTQTASGTSTANIPATRALGIMGDTGASATQIGYMSNVRIVKGTAVYTANFTPSTTNLTAISGTSLLTLQSAAFTDNSTNNFVITPNGNTTVTGNSPFNTVGYWSNYFDGTGDYLSMPSNAAFAFGTGDYTIEGWIYTTVSGTDKRITWFSDDRHNIDINTSNQIFLYDGSIRTFGTIALGAWNHFAVSRTSGTVSCYLNGVRGYNASETTNSTTRSMNIAANNAGNNPFNGSISNIRVVKGTGVYSGATITVPTAPLTAITNTSLLTCQNGQFIDNSTNAFAITVNGNTSVQPYNPFYTATIASNGGSMYFDGTGDYLRGANSPAFAFGTGNFTVEMWAYFMDTGGTNKPLFDNGATSNTGRFLIRQGNDAGTANVVNAFVSGTTVSSPTIQFYSWTHVAVVRNSGTVTIYINGVGGTGVSATADLTQNACLLGAFYDVLTNNFTGYMSNVRVTKGTAVYTANFTPPTSVLTPSANTTLLVNGMNAGAYDATAINNMETVGNAQVRFPTPFAPANYWAGVFDGNGDYLTSPSNAAFALGTGDYTVECWIYATSTPSDQGIYEGRSGGSASDGFTLTAFSSSVIRIFSGGVLVASTGTSYVGQWTHVAVTRASGTTTLWINGVSQGTSATSYNCTNTDAVVGGGRYTGGTTINTSFPGLISNFRIVKGTAVYTSAFTPSTTPLTAISGTSLLTCQNKTFIDNSTNAFTITAFGNATAGAIGPFTATGGTSTYFDGSGDNLFMPSSPSMNCGSGNWTVEGWVSTLTRTTNYPLIFGNNRGSFTTDALAITASNSDSASYNDKFVFAWGSSGFSSPSAGTSALLVSNVTNANGVWYHLAVVRNGTSVKMYRNGTEVASATVSAGATFNWGFNGSLAGGGNWDGAQGNWNGYLDDLRITNGVARYTTTFTPPTQAFPVY